MQFPGGGGGLQLGGGAPKLTGLPLGLQQQQQQHPLQLSTTSNPGQLGLGGGAKLTMGTQPVGTVAPTTGLNLAGGMGLKLGPPASTGGGTSTAGITGLTGGTGLQLGLQQPLGGRPSSGVGGGLQLGGLQQGGLQQAGQVRLQQQPGQTGLTGQIGVSQPQPVSLAPGSSLGFKPQPVLTGMTGGGMKPPPPYAAPPSGLPTLSIGASTATTGLSGFTSKPGTAYVTTPGTTSLGLGLPKPTITSTLGPSLTGLSTSGTTGTTGLSSLTASGAGGSAPQKKYTYKELENLINKWSVELQDQEKVFLQQSNQVNAWDRVLADSGDKVAELNEEVQRVKTEQKRVDSELDLIQTQQQELEELLSTLEKELDSQPTLGVGVHYADMQRTKTFKMAENIDSELKRMGQDLKEIIDQMNSANSNQDEESTFQQIVKILNAHTDSLGWIDRETALLRQKVDDVSKVSEYRKREQERSFRLAFTQ